jgi:hypothetical protein
VGRMVKIPERTIPIEDYFLAQNARTYFRVLMQMTATELRAAKSKEWAGPKRAWLLKAIEERLSKLALAAVSRSRPGTSI